MSAYSDSFFSLLLYVACMKWWYVPEQVVHNDRICANLAWDYVEGY